MSHNAANSVEEAIEKYLAKRAPGFMIVLNSASQKLYGIPCAKLVASSPSSAYKLLLELYGKRADVAVKPLIIIPLLRAGRRHKQLSVKHVLRLVKEGDDSSVLSLLELQPQKPLKVSMVGSITLEEKVFKDVISCAIEVERLAAKAYLRLAQYFDEPYSTAFYYLLHIGRKVHMQEYI